MTGHYPVMLNEVVEQLQVKDGGVYVDCTFGGGGYTKAILDAAKDVHVIAFDRDPTAIERGQALKEQYGERLTLVHKPFSKMAEELNALGIVSIDAVVMDLGVSSYQIDQAERGFSFMQDGPLDMRMSKSGKSAADLVNELAEEKLVQIFRDYGEEPASRKIARAIVHDRKLTPYTTTAELAGLCERVIPQNPKKKKKHAATRVFQALRIAVNSELDELTQVLEDSARMINKKGRIVVVTFHSLEDRIAKNYFNDLAGPRAHVNKYAEMSANQEEEQQGYRLPFRKPLAPTEEETKINIRSRSAKLRVLERV